MTMRISAMLAVEDAPAASAWYQQALGAAQLWSLGTVVGLEIAGAPFFLHESTSPGFDSPAALGRTTARVEVFTDDPDTFIARAVAASADRTDEVTDHPASIDLDPPYPTAGHDPNSCCRTSRRLVGENR